ncbi:minor capsid protein [Marinobacter salarius]|uniref:minor capsid protein n=1 Tax=Marinobacter salarius TaxID=1420917 RepID=UPI003BAD1BED
MSANTFLIDQYTRHQTYVERYSTSERKKMVKYLNETVKLIEGMLDDANTEFSQNRFESLLKSLNTALRDQYKLMSNDIIINATKFAKQELEYNKNILNTATVDNYDVFVPDYEVLAEAALSSKLTLNSKQHDVRSLLAEFSDKQVNTLLNQIRTGVANGFTIPEIRDQVLSKAKLQRKQADTLIRTVNNHISSDARKKVLENNQEILEGFRVIATLDSKTTFICASKDQKVFDLDEPRPPYHYRCRTVHTPVLKQEYQAAIPGLTTRAARIDGKTEQIGAYKTFEGYLSDQPIEFQKDYLGPTRYKLWKQGNLKIDKFVDYNDNELSLDELRAREPEAFDKAGI